MRSFKAFTTKRQTFSLRKLTVGLCSVYLGSLLILGGQTVSADSQVTQPIDSANTTVTTTAITDSQSTTSTVENSTQASEITSTTSSSESTTAIQNSETTNTNSTSQSLNSTTSQDSQQSSTAQFSESTSSSIVQSADSTTLKTATKLAFQSKLALVTTDTNNNPIANSSTLSDNTSGIVTASITSNTATTNLSVGNAITETFNLNVSGTGADYNGGTLQVKITNGKLTTISTTPPRGVTYTIEYVGNDAYVTYTPNLLTGGSDYHIVLSYKPNITDNGGTFEEAVRPDNNSIITSALFLDKEGYLVKDLGTISHQFKSVTNGVGGGSNMSLGQVVGYDTNKDGTIDSGTEATISMFVWTGNWNDATKTASRDYNDPGTGIYDGRTINGLGGNNINQGALVEPIVSGTYDLPLRPYQILSQASKDFGWTEDATGYHLSFDREHNPIGGDSTSNWNNSSDYVPISFVIQEGAPAKAFNGDYYQTVNATYNLSDGTSYTRTNTVKLVTTVPTSQASNSVITLAQNLYSNGDSEIIYAHGQAYYKTDISLSTAAPLDTKYAIDNYTVIEDTVNDNEYYYQVTVDDPSTRGILQNGGSIDVYDNTTGTMLGTITYTNQTLDIPESSKVSTLRYQFNNFILEKNSISTGNISKFTIRENTFFGDWRTLYDDSTITKLTSTTTATLTNCSDATSVTQSKSTDLTRTVVYVSMDDATGVSTWTSRTNVQGGIQHQYTTYASEAATTGSQKQEIDLTAYEPPIRNAYLVDYELVPSDLSKFNVYYDFGNTGKDLYVEKAVTTKSGDTSKQTVWTLSNKYVINGTYTVQTIGYWDNVDANLIPKDGIDLGVVEGITVTAKNSTTRTDTFVLQASTSSGALSKVKGDADRHYTYATSGHRICDQVNFEIDYTNTSATDLTKVELITQLPRLGDVYNDGSSRNSQFDVYLTFASTIEPTTGWHAVYTTATGDAQSIDKATWLTADQVTDWSAITNIKFINDIPIPANTTLQFFIKNAVIANNATEGETAYLSTSDSVDGGVYSESNTVSIKMATTIPDGNLYINYLNTDGNVIKQQIAMFNDLESAYDVSDKDTYYPDILTADDGTYYKLVAAKSDNAPVTGVYSTTDAVMTYIYQKMYGSVVLHFLEEGTEKELASTITYLGENTPAGTYYDTVGIVYSDGITRADGVFYPSRFNLVDADGTLYAFNYNNPDNISGFVQEDVTDVYLYYVAQDMRNNLVVEYYTPTDDGGFYPIKDMVFPYSELGVSPKVNESYDLHDIGGVNYHPEYIVYNGTLYKYSDYGEMTYGTDTGTFTIDRNYFDVVLMYLPTTIQVTQETVLQDADGSDLGVLSEKEVVATDKNFGDDYSTLAKNIPENTDVTSDMGDYLERVITTYILKDNSEATGTLQDTDTELTEDGSKDVVFVVVKNVETIKTMKQGSVTVTHQIEGKEPFINNQPVVSDQDYGTTFTTESQIPATTTRNVEEANRTGVETTTYELVSVTGLDDSSTNDNGTVSGKVDSTLESIVYTYRPVVTTDWVMKQGTVTVTHQIDGQTPFVDHESVVDGDYGQTFETTTRIPETTTRTIDEANRTGVETTKYILVSVEGYSTSATNTEGTIDGTIDQPNQDIIYTYKSVVNTNWVDKVGSITQTTILVDENDNQLEVLSPKETTIENGVYGSEYTTTIKGVPSNPKPEVVDNGNSITTTITTYEILGTPSNANGTIHSDVTDVVYKVVKHVTTNTVMKTGDVTQTTILVDEEGNQLDTLSEKETLLDDAVYGTTYTTSIKGVPENSTKQIDNGNSITTTTTAYTVEPTPANAEGIVQSRETNVVYTVVRHITVETIMKTGSVTQMTLLVDENGDQLQVLSEKEIVKDHVDYGTGYKTFAKGVPTNSSTIEDVSDRIITTTTTYDLQYSPSNTIGSVTAPMTDVIYTIIKRITISEVMKTGTVSQQTILVDDAGNLVELLSPSEVIATGDYGTNYSSTIKGIPSSISEISLVGNDTIQYTTSYKILSQESVTGKIDSPNKEITYKVIKVVTRDLIGHQGSVIVNYVDQEGNRLKSPVLVTNSAKTDSDYDTSAYKLATITTFDGKVYRLVAVQGAEVGKVREGETQVTYVFQEVLKVITKWTDESGHFLKSSVTSTVTLPAGSINHPISIC